MVEQRYRWDFIGLSTDEKPTPETSYKVVNGSTFYCSDTSKLYVFYKDTWYERKPLGSGGGGTSYTAGNGIDISNDTISVDTTVVQEKLTAGSNITIDENNVISASGGGGSITPVQTTGTSTTDVMSQNAVTSMVFDDPSNCVNVKIGSQTRVSTPNGSVVIGERASGSGNGISIGSQSSGHNECITIGKQASNVSNYCVVIGNGAYGGNRNGGTAIGNSANVGGLHAGSVALGASSSCTRAGEVYIGSDNTNYGYNSTNYRVLGGVHDPVDAHDAATKGYVDANAGGVKTLTTADYNFPSNSPNTIAPWLLPVGQYIVEPYTNVLPDGNSSQYNSGFRYGLLVFTQATSNDNGTFIISGNNLNGYYKVEYNGTPVTGFPHEI